MDEVVIGAKPSRQLRRSKVVRDAHRPIRWLPRNASGVKPNSNAYFLLQSQVLCHVDNIIGGQGSLLEANSQDTLPHRLKIATRLE